MKHLNRLDHPFIIDSSTAVSRDLSAIGRGQLALVLTFWPGRSVVEVVVLQVSNADKLLPSVCRAFLGCQVKRAVDELNLSKKIISCHPSSLPLPDHVDCFVALNRSPSRLEFSEALLGVQRLMAR